MEEKSRLKRWIIIWLCIGYAIIAWDVLFVFMRPASFPGGSLAGVWLPYAEYIRVDLSYGDINNPFIWAQAIMSVIEISMVVAALYLNYRRRLPPAILLVFCASALTCAKTLLILLVEIVSGFENIGHNSLADMLFLYFVPNAVWILMPLLVVMSTGQFIIAQVDKRPVMPSHSSSFSTTNGNQ